jgi:UDP-N-acetylmuramate dehydrogenase
MNDLDRSPVMQRDDSIAVRRGALLPAEPMAKHVSWRAGGRARQAYVPRDLADLQVFLRGLPPGEPMLFVGLGSNLLVRDGGYQGTVVLMHDARAQAQTEDDEILAAAGLASPKLARFAANLGLRGAEFLAGVPGTVGGALAMNAGCYGSETWDAVTRVQTIDRSGEVHVRRRDEYDIGYRHCQRHAAHETPQRDEWFTAAWFKFSRGSAAASRMRIRDLLARRVASQPLNLPNAGSVFRNPPNDFAARLIESCGLKGFGVGGVRVSEKHANFIVNPGGRGSAADIETLIEHVRRVVWEQHGIELVPEVQIVGSEGSEGEPHRWGRSAQ